MVAFEYYRNSMSRSVATCALALIALCVPACAQQTPTPHTPTQQTPAQQTPAKTPTPPLPAHGNSAGSEGVTHSAPNSGMLCIIKNVTEGQTSFYASVPYDPFTLEFRVDGGEKIPWPQKPGHKVEGLDLEQRHVVALYSKGKRFQSFRFSFKDYQATELCLLFDGYGGPDLCPMSRMCGCKKAK
jgi:hypothetical protein